MAEVSREVEDQKKKKVPRDVWTDKQTEALIGFYGKVYVKKNKGNLRPKDWEEISNEFTKWATATGNENKSKLQIQNKADNLKKRYRVEKDQEGVTGGTPSEWPWFDLFNEVLGDDPKYCGVLNGMDGSSMISQDSDVQVLESVQDSQIFGGSYIDLLTEDSPSSGAKSASEPETTPPSGPTQIPVISLEDEVVTPATKPFKDTGVKVKVTSGKKRSRANRNLEDFSSCVQSFMSAFERVADKHAQQSANTQLEIARLILGAQPREPQI